MNPPRTLETERLRLRPPALDDAQAIFGEYAQDPQVTRYLTRRPHDSVETTRTFLRRCVQSWERETAFPWVITHKADGRLVGMIEPRIDGHRVDLGYVLARPSWGQGLATEAARVVVDWALGEPGVFRVWAVCDADNGASRNLSMRMRHRGHEFSGGAPPLVRSGRAAR
jgi:ribosomal-protein-alanine N-acetyltransferase